MLVSQAPIPEAVARQAIEWMLALQAEDAQDSVRQAWQLWLGQHPDHARAWQRIADMHGNLQGLALPFKSALAHATLAPSRSSRRRQAIQTLVALLCVGGATSNGYRYLPWRTWTSDYRTAIGQQRVVTLEDGSTLDLDTDSAVDVAYRSHERLLRLHAGRIWVNAVADLVSGRLFCVETQEGRIQTLQAEFVVQQRHELSRVAVASGELDIRPLRSVGPATLLRAEQQADFTLLSVGVLEQVPANDWAWRKGMLIVEGMPLSDFLQALGRYHPQALSCDPAVAGLRISGSFIVEDLSRVMDTLQATLPISVQTRRRPWGSESVRLMSRGQSA